MQEKTKHALSNPTLWINISSLVSALVITASNDEWIKHYPLVVVGLGALNFAVTGFLQYLRDMNKHPASKSDKQVCSQQ